MNVELTEGGRRKVEQLVGDGKFPSVEAAVDAAIEYLEDAERDYSAEELDVLLARGRADLKAGRVRPGDEVLSALRETITQRAQAPRSA